jgi:hypothetical protein
VIKLRVVAGAWNAFSRVVLYPATRLLPRLIRAARRPAGSVELWVVNCEESHDPAVIKVVESAAGLEVEDCSSPTWGDCGRSCLIHLQMRQRQVQWQAARK